MKPCWAHCLGDCSEKLSREHLISKSLFVGEAVKVQGFAWCKDRPKEIGLDGLTAKILCEYHNSALCPVDQAGAKAFSIIREMRRLANVRQKMNPRIWQVVEHTIDGRGLERWFLKTPVNLCYDSELRIGRGTPIVGRPPEKLVRIVYGTEAFTDRAGLYFAVRSGMQVDSSDTVSFAPLVRDGTHIEGGVFTFRGLRFLLFLEADGPPEPLTGVFIDGEDLGGCQLNFHNRTISETAGKYRSQLLTITW